MKNIFQFARFTSAWLTARLNVKSERGATAVEYGVMVALIAAVIIGVVYTLGQNAKTKFDCTGKALSAPSATGC